MLYNISFCLSIHRNYMLKVLRNDYAGILLWCFDNEESNKQKS